MKKIIISLTVALLAFAPALQAGEGKAPEKNKPACCDKQKADCPKKDACPVEKGGKCPMEKGKGKQCPASKDEKPAKKS